MISLWAGYGVMWQHVCYVDRRPWKPVETCGNLRNWSSLLSVIRCASWIRGVVVIPAIYYKQLPYHPTAALVDTPPHYFSEFRSGCPICPHISRIRHPKWSPGMVRGFNSCSAGLLSMRHRQDNVVGRMISFPNPTFSSFICWYQTGFT